MLGEQRGAGADQASCPVDTVGRSPTNYQQCCLAAQGRGPGLNPPFPPHGLAAGPGFPPALPAEFPDLRAEGGHLHRAGCSGAPLREASAVQMQTPSSLTLLRELPLNLAVTGDGGRVWGPSEEPHGLLWPEGLEQA